MKFVLLTMVLKAWKNASIKAGVVLSLITVFNCSTAQTLLPSQPARDISDSANIRYDSLEKIYGKNKVIPTQYAKQLIYALSYFPELVNTKIKLKIINSEKGLISTNLTFGSVFRKASKRTYIIKIFEPSAGSNIPLFVNAGINGQAGIFGHELCHIVYFGTKNTFGLIGLGISHVSVKYMDQFERNTDSADIARGLGYQLLAWKAYLNKGFAVMRNDIIPHEEKYPGGKRYMSESAIQEQMSRTEKYVGLDSRW
ncbi:hypothetical protein [Pollutibacter soli]|uniref:hypothetical protein n=1 Tax=Pollutibacter soli TaxID=3034157 RepID=UPI00301405A9